MNKWRKYTGNDDPSTLGILAGTYRQGIKAYVGRGIFDRQFVPGRIQVIHPIGLYHPSALSIHRIVDSAEYLVNNETQSYEWVNAQDGLPVESAVIPGYTPGRTLWYIARVQFGGFTYMGKAHLNAGLNYENENGKEVNTRQYQVLICSVKCKKCDETSIPCRRRP